MLMRCCTKCDKSLPATTEFFNRNKYRGKEGLRGDCLECVKAIKRKHYASNDEVKRKLAESTKRRRELAEVREQERIYARDKKREQRSTEEGAAKLRDYVREWRAANPSKYDGYKKNYKGYTPKILAKNVTRELRKKRATPPWVKLKDILPFYERAAELTRQTGIKHSVDHIMPLKGKNSSGLHVPWNLQVITLSDNCAKGNRICQT
jgi:hypothetical protein